MKKLLLLLIILVASIGCNHQKFSKLYEETIIEMDSLNEYGVYRKIIRNYTYTYEDTFYHVQTIDSTHYMGVFTNEFGDTIQINFIDTANFPKREE